MVNALRFLFQGLLAAPKTFLAWFRERWAKMDLFDEGQRGEGQGQSLVHPRAACGDRVWILVIVSGVVLMIYYIPVTDQAYHSIERIQNNWRWGPRAHRLHGPGPAQDGADAFIILATMRVYRMWFTGEYKQGNEFTFIIALLLLIIGMYSGPHRLPAHLEPAGPVGHQGDGHLPHLPGPEPRLAPPGRAHQLTNQGKTTAQILLGGTSIGPATVTRFYAFHFMLSFIPMVFFELRVYRTGFKRMNINHWAKLAVFAIILAIAIMIPAAQGSPANPEVTPNPILSDW